MNDLKSAVSTAFANVVASGSGAEAHDFDTSFPYND